MEELIMVVIGQGKEARICMVVDGESVVEFNGPEEGGKIITLLDALEIDYKQIQL